MSAQTQTMKPPSRLLFALELRALPELGSFFASLPMLTAVTPRGDGHPVLVLPGLVTSDRSTVPLRTFLKTKGYDVHGWEQGRNYGPLPGVERKMIDKVKSLAARSRSSGRASAASMRASWQKCCRTRSASS